MRHLPFLLALMSVMRRSKDPYRISMLCLMVWCSTRPRCSENICGVNEERQQAVVHSVALLSDLFIARGTSIDSHLSPHLMKIWMLAITGGGCSGCMDTGFPWNFPAIPGPRVLGKGKETICCIQDFSACGFTSLQACPRAGRWIPPRKELSTSSSE